MFARLKNRRNQECLSVLSVDVNFSEQLAEATAHTPSSVTPLSPHRARPPFSYHANAICTTTSSSHFLFFPRMLLLRENELPAGSLLQIALSLFHFHLCTISSRYGARTNGATRRRISSTDTTEPKRLTSSLRSKGIGTISARCSTARNDDMDAFPGGQIMTHERAQACTRESIETNSVARGACGWPSCHARPSTFPPAQERGACCQSASPATTA